MSLITRCPACETHFKVVQDQLRISDGWVRCGKCSEVFDANAHLQQAEPVEVPAVASPPLPDDDWEEAVHRTVQGFFPKTQPESSQAVDVDLSDPKAWREPTPAVETPERDDSEGSAADSDALAGGALLSSESAADSFLQESPLGGGGIPEDEQLAHQPGRTVDEHGPRTDPAFMRRNIRGQSRLYSYALGFAVASLALVLTLQLILFERDRLASTAPVLKSSLMALCELAGCEVQPVRQIKSWVIDASSFTKLRPDVYDLHVTIKNVAAVELLIPSLELTLTDHQDQPVIRRVIDRSQFAGTQSVALPGSEVSATLPLQVKLPGGVERVAGYRLTAFYP
jgi:predicted Zn finger-like uncharacterized protein